jgi:hypothetical protein
LMSTATTTNSGHSSSKPSPEQTTSMRRFIAGLPR